MQRHRVLGVGEKKRGKVVYWMSRDQRVKDNHALLFAQQLAKNSQLEVVFNLIPEFLEASWQYSFMLEGLKKVQEDLTKLNIGFNLFEGKPEETISELNCSALITDFDPLKNKKEWKKKVNDKINVPFYEVDTHNIVPCFLFEKQEYAAHTFRPKIKKLLPKYLKPIPRLKKQKIKCPPTVIPWKKYKFPKNKVPSGEDEARKVLEEFKKKDYSKRNNPNEDATSNLSPYLHFGQISSQRVALEIKNEEFREELIVRKELADNYCHFNENYDNMGFPDWALKSLEKHEKDKRDYVYSKSEFEKAKTHDKLWNAAQNQMIKTGKMHGYMRMYWAKKILEWSTSPKHAQQIAIYLNDKYELDGRDPNGYTGIAWSIGGVHDRPWAERKVFGKVRYMSYDGCKKKFDVDEFISRFS